jgi:hypothetical protein
MANVRPNDPLVHIYQDIADHYDHSEFKEANHDKEHNNYRH